MSELERNPTVVDLFSGVGGFSLGAAKAGFRVVAAVDVDPIANETYSKNFPNTPCLQKDVTNLSGRQALATAGMKPGDVDGVIGGPPCQGFSFMGRKRSDDARNALFVEFFRLVDEIDPKFFVAENVPGILAPRYEATRKEAVSLVNGRYFVLDPIKLKASDCGASTSRTRVFFFGFRRDFMELSKMAGFRKLLGSSKKDAMSVGQALEGLPSIIDPSWQSEPQSWRETERIADPNRDSLYRSFIPSGVGDPTACMLLRTENLVSGFMGTAHTKEVIARISRLKPGEVDKVSKAKRLDRDGVCPTLRAGTDSAHGSFQALRPIHFSENRVITTREAARLQGFPDWFVFHPTKWHSFRQIGNSVSPIMAETVLRTILTYC